MPPRVVVIGGSGFIGTPLVRRLLAAGADVRIADKVHSETYPELTTLCDVRDRASLLAACADSEVIYNLAAEHRDDVRPASLYQQVNVGGARNTCEVARQLGVQRIVFVSSVAVYGFGDRECAETATPHPFNDYGRSKLEAEEVFREWLGDDHSRSLTIVRSTVVFGEGNRANVYNLLRQIARGPFLMIGGGRNPKSMAYVENVAAFLTYALRFKEGFHLYNYVDKPDLDMNRLVATIRTALGRSPSIRFRVPYALGYLAGLGFDGIAAITGRSLPISRIRIRKFCSPSQVSAERLQSTGFRSPYDLGRALARTIQHEFGEETTPAAIAQEGELR